MIRRSLLLALVLSLSTGCSYFRGRSEKPDTSGYNIEQVLHDIAPLDPTPLDPNAPSPYSPAIQKYFSFYSLNPPHIKHYFGTVESEGQTLVAHAFVPVNPRGTLFLIHGYFDHTGTLTRLIAQALARNYAVLAWDLPGHGLSSGGRTETGDFDLCAKQFIDIAERAEALLPPPFHLISHSTGCSIAIEYFNHTPDNIFEGTVFLAPLVKHTHWNWAKFGHTIARPFTKGVRRRNVYNSSDEAYLAFVKKDPLHSSGLSFRYLEDLYEWEKRFRDYPVWPGSVCIIQGTADSVVDWEYNLDFLTDKIEDVTIYMIPDARHQLINENEKIRTEVFRLIFDYLEKAEKPGRP